MYVNLASVSAASAKTFFAVHQQNFVVQCDARNAIIIIKFMIYKNKEIFIECEIIIFGLRERLSCGDVFNLSHLIATFRGNIYWGFLLIQVLLMFECLNWKASAYQEGKNFANFIHLSRHSNTFRLISTVKAAPRLLPGHSQSFCFERHCQNSAWFMELNFIKNEK